MWVIDITLPESPVVLNRIPFPASVVGGSMGAITYRASDGLLEMASSPNNIILDPAYLAITNFPVTGLPQVIAAAGFIANAGGIQRAQGSAPDGLRAVADSGRNVVVQSPPPMQFVHFPSLSAPVDPRQQATDDGSLDALFGVMQPESSVLPARLHPALDVGLRHRSRPSGAFALQCAHHRRVPADQPLNSGWNPCDSAGQPLCNRGSGFAPVRAISDSAQKSINQLPRAGCGAPVRSLTAWRLSSNPSSQYYNQYLSRPFALICEHVSLNELTQLTTTPDREILWSGAFLRAFIDPSMSANQVISQFAAQADIKHNLIYPIAVVQAVSLDASYVMGDNPSPAGGYDSMPGTMGTVSTHSGEFRTETMDMCLPSPRMPVEFHRAIGGQDTYEGPFGPGWDFNYNQRLTEFGLGVFPEGLEMPLIVRDVKADSEVAVSGDIMFHSGGGRSIHFNNVGTNLPPEYASTRSSRSLAGIRASWRPISCPRAVSGTCS